MFRVRLRLDRPFAHAVAASYQIDQRRHEWNEDEEQDPGGLCPTRDLVVAKQVAEDRDQDPDPDHEEEDLEGYEERFSKLDVGKKQSGSFRRFGGPPSRNLDGVLRLRYLS